MDRWKNDIRTGEMVHTHDNRMLGTVERVHGDGFDVKGQRIPFSDVDRVEGNTVFLKTGTRWANVLGTDTMTRERTVGDDVRGLRTDTREGTIRVPVAEERLNVEKRAGELGQVEIRKNVTEQQVQVPVDLTRENVRVERVDVPDRPLARGELDNAFQEGTIRVPIRGEEAVVNKEAVVTGEVVINKERQTERQMVSDTVRKEQVSVDDSYKRLRNGFQQDFDRNRVRAVGGRTRTFTDAEPNYRYGVEAAHDPRYRGRKWSEVEPNLRRDWETRPATTTTTTATRTTTDPWDQLREEVREGFERVR